MLLKHTNTQVVKRKILRQVIQVRMGVVGTICPDDDTGGEGTD